MGTQLTLQVYKGEQLVTAKDFDRDIIKIGRLASAHLCLDDDKVSRIHSVIEVSTEGLMSIIDMGSIEGTYVNGKRVNKSAIAYGDEIRIGNSTIKVSTQAAAEQLQQAAAVGAQDGAEVKPAGAVVLGRLSAPALDPSFAATQQNLVGAARSASAPRVAQERVPRPAAVATPAARAAPAVARAARASGQASERKGLLGLSIRMMWGDQMLAEHLLRPDRAGTFVVGSGKNVDFVMGDGALGGPSFVLVRTDPSGAHAVRFSEKMRGELHRGGHPLELRKAIEAGQATQDGEGYALQLDADDFVWIDLGGITFEASFKPVPRPVLVPFSETLDYRILNILLVMLFAGALFMINAANSALEGDTYSDELSGDQARIAKLIIKPPDIKKNPLLARLEKSKEQKAAGELAAKQKKDEGQMGRKDQPKTNRHTAPQGKPDHKDQARQLAKKIFGTGGMSTVFGKSGLGGELKSAMGSMFGAKAGNSGGFGGLGLKGTASGGGGGGETIGIGGVGTRGRGGGTAGYGSGVGSLGGKQETDIGITSSEPMVSGSLDKELIRKVIHSNRGQIRFCYETQLNRFPKLSGKVAITFVISASGSVATSKASQNTTANQELETCIVGRVRTWTFPKPKGGGSVIVTYPFIFKQAGQ